MKGLTIMMITLLVISLLVGVLSAEEKVNVDTDINFLIEILTNPQETARREAALRLGELGSDAVEAIPVLVTALRDDDPNVVWAASTALEKIGSKVVPAVSNLLQDSDEKIREQAIKILSNIGANAGEAIDELKLALTDSNSEVRRLAVVTLEKIGQTAEKAVPFLVLALGDSEFRVSFAAFRATQTLGIELSEQVPALIEFLNNENIQVRQSAIRAIIDIGQEAQAAIPDLIKALEDTDIDVRRYAAMALKEMGEAEKALPALALALGDSSERVFRQALDAIQLIASKQEAVLRLLELLEEQNVEVQIKAVRGLGRIGDKAQLAVPGLIQLLEVEEFQIRKEAVIALGNIGAKAETAVPVLLDHLSDKNIKIEVIKALGKIGSKAEVGVSDLISFLYNEDIEVRQAAAEALGGIGSNAEKAIPALVEALQDEEQLVRRAAGQAITSIGSVTEDSIQIYIQMLREFEQKEKAIETLVEIGDKSIPYLIELLGDRDINIRIRAANVLIEIGPVAVNALIQSLNHNQEVVRELAAWSLSQMGSKAEKAVPALGEALLDSAAGEMAARALNEIGTETALILQKESVSKLVQQLQASNGTGLAALLRTSQTDKKSVIRTLMQIGSIAEEAVPELIKLLKANDEKVSTAALWALRKIAPEREDVIAALARHIGEPFFDLVDLSHKEFSEIRSLIEKDNYYLALETYRDYFVDKLATNPVKASSNFGGLQSISQVSQNRWDLTSVETMGPGTEGMSFIYDLGEVGSMDWLIEYVDLPQKQALEGMQRRAAKMDRPAVYINQFVRNPDKYGHYIKMWSAVWADFSSRHHLLPGTGRYWGHQFWMAGRSDRLLQQLIVGAMSAPDKFKNNLPALDLAMILTPHVKMVDRLAGISGGGAPNQAIHAITSLLKMSITWDHFNNSSYWQKRVGELAQVYMDMTYMADGTDMEQSLNYNMALVNAGRNFLQLYADSEPPQWLSDFKQAMLYRMRFLQSLVRHNVIGMLPVLQNQSDNSRGQQQLMAYQDILNDDLAEQINSFVWDDGSYIEPAFTSIQFPYGGYYVIRSGWDYNDHHLFLKGSRPGRGHGGVHSNNSIQVTAFGRTMLISSGGPRTFDPSISGRQYTLSPYGHNTITIDGSSVASWSNTPNDAYTEVIASRWHSSDYFDFTETILPYIDKQSQAYTTSRGLEYAREIIFLRDKGIYIVTDRINANREHEYNQIWNFESRFAENEVDVILEENRIMTTNKQGPNITLFSFTDSPLRYSKYYGYDQGGTAYGWQNRNNPAVDVHVTWSGEGDQQLITMIRPLEGTDDGIVSIKDTSFDNIRGFITELEDDTQIIYQSAIDVAELNIGDITIIGEGLLVVEEKNEPVRGIALSAKEFNVKGYNKIEISVDNFEFTLTKEELIINEIRKPKTFKWIEDGEEIYPEYYYDRQENIFTFN